MRHYFDYAKGWDMPEASDVRVIHGDGREELRPRDSFIERSRAGRHSRRNGNRKAMRDYAIKPKRQARLWR